MTPPRTIAPVRWQELPARISIVSEAGTDIESEPQADRVYYQITSPLLLTEICLGRPVEELPRILTFLGPAHHLCAAAALDALMGVTAPALALNMREALRQALLLTCHLRRLYCLLSARVQPLPYENVTQPTASRSVLTMQTTLMQQIALVQEAATILGGRCDHPITSLAGGVSRYLKTDHFDRLATIAEALEGFTAHLADWCRQELWAGGRFLEPYLNISAPPLAGLIQVPPKDSPEATDETLPMELMLGHTPETAVRFSVRDVWQHIDLARKPWSYRGFAFQRDKGWSDLNESTAHLLFAGPLARLNAGLNSGTAFSTNSAAAEYARLQQTLGPGPHYSVVAAYWALVIEALQAAATLGPLCQPEKLLGPFTRHYSENIGSTGAAALEAPGGLICHYYEVDAAGRVTHLKVLDTAEANNALRNLVAQQAWQVLGASGPSRARTPIEISLLPF